MLLVVDSDVIQSCSPLGSQHPIGSRNRDFLIGILEICHHVVLTDEISDEWRNHSSSFFRKWRLSMHAKKKFDRVITPDSLGTKLEKLDVSEKAIAAMLKDVHLIDAALCADCIVISMDEKAHNLFINASDRIKKIKRVRWLNPINDLAADI